MSYNKLMQKALFVKLVPTDVIIPSSSMLTMHLVIRELSISEAKYQRLKVKSKTKEK